MAALEVFHSQCRAAHGLPLTFGQHNRGRTFSQLSSCHLWSRGGGSFSLKISHNLQHILPIGRRRNVRLKVAAEAQDGEAGETTISDEKVAEKLDEKLAEKTGENVAEKTKERENRGAEIRGTITGFFEQKSGYSWLLGPAAISAAIVLPSSWVNLASLFQNNFLAGLAAVSALDVSFVLAADLYLVLADKLGHHQQVSGGPPPWIGPWEYTGYPKGYPKFLNYVAYSSVGVGILGILLSIFTGKLGGAVATFGPILGLIFAQVAYERLLGNDRVPVFPLVPILYTVYRFRQLSRAVALVPVVADGSGILLRCLHLSSILWAIYLAMYLTQLPWLYSTWNANRST